ncbi:MAG TPA: tRNA (N(6)-L-threonylcarbamoyladenosine(37)-C(2))-methylthiotransferase MtaB [Saprospiraceae bacterium]|nr:tRNA (N(6)-L-threonylcarbamoyladenosine(37)-C(2))-methylthiotransferase MtaB [Saprospiraceae bacterium]HNT20875.1 tRNA (N(6)-L-threonylcarbamoyladenosine(37)-C(2))-methylthiotransferase MtaB [Saprospiraceae bacterium]
MGAPRSIAFHTLGCKLNYAETSTLQSLCEKEGLQVLEFDQPADIYVINTCSVTEQADKKCRYAIRQALNISPQAKVIVTGCYAQLKPAEIVDIPGVSLVLGAGEKFRLTEYLDALAQSNGLSPLQSGTIGEVRTFNSSYSFGDRTRSFLKVQDGCDYKCSFCTIPLARGRSRSDTVEHAVEKAREIAANGVREIVLTGINLGDFGNGTEVIEGMRPKKSALFIDLIRALDEEAGLPRIRISSIEPNLLTDEIIEFVAGSRRFMPHFHIPLQSGSDELLRLMQRRYVSSLYASRVEYIKSLMPHACIGVDVITGFPGETERHFRETYEFLHRMDVSYLHVFTYSERQNTPAVHLPHSVPVHLRRERNEILRQLSEKKKHFFYQSHLGTSRPVLLEHDGNDRQWCGFTDNYIKVYVDKNAGAPNEIVMARLEGFNGLGEMEGEVIYQFAG